MKIPTEHVDLSKLGYEGYWIEMPRTVKEGFLHDLSANRPKAGKNGQEAEDTTSDQSRDANIQILSLVTAWNIDDDDGKVFPILSKAKNRAEQEKIVSELPVDIIMHVAQRITSSVSIAEGTKDF